MRKTLTAALAALTLGGAISATAVTGAQARPWDHHYYGYGRGGNGAAVVAGVAGLAIGAAIAGDHPRYYGYGPGPYAYGPGYYGTCFTTRWVWDGYGRRIPERVPYAC